MISSDERAAGSRSLTEAVVPCVQHFPLQFLTEAPETKIFLWNRGLTFVFLVRACNDTCLFYGQKTLLGEGLPSQLVDSWGYL